MCKPDDDPVIGIAGGHGGIGSFFARLCAGAGLRVLVSDRDTALSNVDLAARCDLALVAVPLRLTPEVLAEMAPHVPPDGALASLGSLMEPALAALGACRGERLLLHPLFGPGRKSLRGAALACVPLRSGPRAEWLLRLLQTRGARIVTTTPQEHDRTMATAQALLHGAYAALAPEIMSALTHGEPPRDEPPRGEPSEDDAPPHLRAEATPAGPLDWASPTLRLQLALMSRILHQNSRLYGDLLALNRHTPAAIDLLLARLVRLRAALGDGPDAVAALFDAARTELGPLGPALAAQGDRALGEG